MVEPTPQLESTQASQERSVFFTGLSARLLWLTVAFIMLCEVFIFAPSIARFRVQYLEMKLDAAHLTLTALEAADMVDPELQRRLLNQAGVLGMTVIRPGMPARTLGPDMPSRIPLLFDLRDDMPLTLIADALSCLIQPKDMVIGATGWSPSDPTVLVEVILPEAPLRRALIDYGLRIFLLSLLISVVTAALVYLSIQWLAVRPMRRLTANMISFQDSPQDGDRVMRPGGRRDEVGIAERALADMQTQLRTALTQKERLVGVGTAVTKVSHDLKNILATAMLESDRLDQSDDPEVRRITSGLVKAIDRAIHLCTKTLRFAKEGPPRVERSDIEMTSFLGEIKAGLAPVLESCEMVVSVPPNCYAHADPDLLRRAIENLVRNAAEAGATELTITVEPESGGLCVVVTDNGPGLPAKALEHLFVPFSGSARSGGSGLGLPISRESIRAQGGDMVLRQSSEAGAVFEIRLPN
ncbi:MAG: HAMP domain-containing histidine kinase [Rhodospirillaceae bacterium]|jgi:signal transduction histidine kinase|nr:HAMP domain-containing histidine kinase [Rhodospirillaceae bacterium]MBT5566018.1 HAMP domain-containing histidine kinase [Rhodospirillaceae bacterium]MBT6089028.1 HAMP domain-containing histidine kinase [Rhodospirillaceae bacterium]MBT6959671.1 HAMP domain-containing histidine kinase [Rhodospirillaceae bacterium]